MKKIFCNYCGKIAEYVDSTEIYGRSYGMIYLCRPCRAYVGVHKGTDKPLGRLANAELRAYKKAAHSAFDPLWSWPGSPFFRRRNKAYKWLSEQMKLPQEETHIGMFDVTQCKRVIEICKKGGVDYAGKINY